MFAQRTAGVLIQRFDVFCNSRAGQNTKVFDHLKGKATGKPRQLFVAAKVQQRFEQRGHFAINEMLQATLHFLRHIGACDVIDEDLNLWLHCISASNQFAHSGRAPHQAALLCEINFGVWSVIESVCAQVELRAQCLQRGRLDRLCLGHTCALVLAKAETIQLANKFAFYGYFTCVVYFGHYGFLLSQSAQKHGRAPIYKSLGQTLVQRIRQAVFYDTCLLSPMVFVIAPAFALRNVGPGADKREPFGQRVDVTVRAIDAVDLACQPFIRQAAALVQIVENCGSQIGVFTVTDAAKIGHTADIPQQLDRRAVCGARLDLGDLRQRLQRLQIVRLAGPHQHLVIGGGLKRFDQPFDRSKLQRVIAVVQFLLGGEAMIHDRLRNPVIQRIGIACDAKRAVLHAPPGAPGNLRQFVGGQGAHPPPVKFGGGRKRHVIHIQI